MSWYQTAFGARYLELYAHRDADEAARAVASLFESSELADTRVLDLACGAGRYLPELKRRGARAIGLDLSQVLLDEARRTGSGEDLIRADMRWIPLRDGAVDTTLSMFTSFGYFQTVEEHAELAREMGRVTRRDIVIDVPNPTVLARGLVKESERRLAGRRVREQRWIEHDPLRVCKRIEIEGREASEVEAYEERVLLFSLSELESLFAPEGFAVRRVLGDYDGHAFDAAESPRVIVRSTRDGRSGA